MERNPGRLIEQLQSVQIRQRKIIQQLQAENARRLSDLADIRQERDMFRKEADRARKENAELRGKLEEVWTEYQDLKRERATLTRSLVTVGHAHARNSNLKITSGLSALNEEQGESLSAESTSMDKAERPELELYLHRALPDPPPSESPEPQADHPMPAALPGRSNSRGGISRVRTALRGIECTTL